MGRGVVNVIARVCMRETQTANVRAGGKGAGLKGTLGRQREGQKPLTLAGLGDRKGPVSRSLQKLEKARKYTVPRIPRKQHGPADTLFLAQ